MTRHFEKKVAQFLEKPKYLQQSQFQKSKYLHQSTFQISKYLQQSLFQTSKYLHQTWFWNGLFRWKSKKNFYFKKYPKILPFFWATFSKKKSPWSTKSSPNGEISPNLVTLLDTQTIAILPKNVTKYNYKYFLLNVLPLPLITSCSNVTNY